MVRTDAPSGTEGRRADPKSPMNSGGTAGPSSSKIPFGCLIFGRSGWPHGSCPSWPVNPPKCRTNPASPCIRTLADLRKAEDIIVHGFPLEEYQPLETGTVFPAEVRNQALFLKATAKALASPWPPGKSVASTGSPRKPSTKASAGPSCTPSYGTSIRPPRHADRLAVRQGALREARLHQLLGDAHRSGPWNIIARSPYQAERGPRDRRPSTIPATKSATSCAR